MQPSKKLVHICAAFLDPHLKMQVFSNHMLSLVGYYPHQVKECFIKHTERFELVNTDKVLVVDPPVP